MRIAVAGVLGGLALFVWGVLAHTVLPLGHVGIQAPGDEAALIEAARDALPRSGVYYLPYIDDADMGDEAKVDAWAQKAIAGPYALVIYDPVGEDPRQMADNLALQLVGDVVLGVLLAWLLAAIGGGFARRLTAGAVTALIAWLAISAPYWNWYRFPLDFSLANLAEQLVGLLAAAAAIAWWLGRGERSA